MIELVRMQHKADLYVLPKSQIIWDLGRQNPKLLVFGIWDLGFRQKILIIIWDLGFGILAFGILAFGF